MGWNRLKDSVFAVGVSIGSYHPIVEVDNTCLMLQKLAINIATEG